MLVLLKPCGMLRIAVYVPDPEGTLVIANEELAFLHCRLTSVNAII